MEGVKRFEIAIYDGSLLNVSSVAARTAEYSHVSA